ncbi:MAG: ACT domain-containing protein [Solirubrobacterales bacterium]
MNLAVTAIGRDRPGIVAAITGALLDFDGNVDDSQMSILHGQFAVMLIVSVPEGADLDGISAKLEEVGRDFDLGGITVSPVSELDRGAGPTHVLTVYGADRPGIVHDIAALLATSKVNITDLRTRRTGGSEAPLYSMLIEVSVPPSATGLADALADLSGTVGVEAHLAELETEVI